MKGVGEFPIPAGFDRGQANAGPRGASMLPYRYGQHAAAAAAGKQILFLIQTDAFVPCFWRLSNHLGARGYQVVFAAFQPRERLWLRKNGIRSQPDSVHALKDYPIKPLLDGSQIEEILDFALRRSGGKREHWEQRLLRVSSFLDDLLERHEFRAVVIWNGEDFIGRTLAVMSGKRGIRTIFCENGYFPDTLQFDPQGVNVHSSVMRLPFAEILRLVETPTPASIPGRETNASLRELTPLAWSDYLRCFLARKANPRYYRHFPEHRGGSWFKSQWLRMKRSLIPSDERALPGKYIFLPFQVHDDTQVLLNSRFFKSMEEFFEFCHAAIKRNFGNEYAIVVKEHPEDLGRYSYKSLRRKYPDVVWLRKYSVDILLEAADLVFVVNSSVGLQALQKGRPTVTFGESFYAREEIAFPVRDLGRVDEVLAQARLGMTAERKDRIDRFIRFLKERYFVPGGWKSATAAGTAAAGDRIIELIEGISTTSDGMGDAGHGQAPGQGLARRREAVPSELPRGSQVSG